MTTHRQARAELTRQTILDAAATVFEESGYDAATVAEILARAKVTKGAFYFHFATKEELAQSVMARQLDQQQLPAQEVKLQELVDHALVLAHRLQHDPLTRAGIGLSLSPAVGRLDRSTPFRAWIELVCGLLSAARTQGELLPQVDPEETAELLAGAFTGIQELSHVIDGRRRLPARIRVMMRHVLPSVAVPAVLANLDLGEDRALRVLGVPGATGPKHL